MLEKLGLPSKPSNRGAVWVVDASHCQGCSCQFTFINRKHHCRRCGGLFCGSCTQQRMALRGQGDSPVRICEPCKKLEEAAKFELRYGHKNKAAKGNMKQVPMNEEEVLSQILGTDRRQASVSGHESHFDGSSSNLQKSASSASSSSLSRESAAPGRDIDALRSLSVGTHGNTSIDIGSSSPEELRQQAMEQKNKYRILKGEGKSDEALQAFKFSKELERQAGALELALRKSRRIASKAPNVNNVAETPKTNDYEESHSKKLPSRRVKDGKDDLATDLRELGWSDADLHDADKKPAKQMTLEGELLNLLGEMPKKSSAGNGVGGIDNTQVLAHKRRALTLKKEGKLAEAKEELKRAKILEKQLEEEKLLGEAEESDDELSSLIHSMNTEKQDNELKLGHAPAPDFNFEHLLGAANDFALDGDFEVTDDDMNNPDLAADLKSFGWDEEDQDAGIAHNVLQPAEVMQKFPSPYLSSEASVVRTANVQTVTETVNMPPKSKMMIQRELLNLKKKALALRREGHVEAAEEELRKGKILEQQLEEMENGPKRPSINAGKKVLQPPQVNVRDAGILAVTDEVEADVTEEDMHDPALLSVLENLGWNEGSSNEPVNMPPKSKMMIQRELLNLKKKALALRREGRVEEAEEELRKGKILEQQLEEMENGPKRPAINVGKKILQPPHVNVHGAGILDLTDEVEADVTDEDMQDPTLLSVLENLGWNNDSNNEPVSMPGRTAKNTSHHYVQQNVPSVTTQKRMRSKAVVQKELLGVKRQALALRRQGKTQEAEEELERAKALENEMADIENATSVTVESHDLGSFIPPESSDSRKADSSVIKSRISKDGEPPQKKSKDAEAPSSKDAVFALPKSLESSDTIDSQSGGVTNILHSTSEVQHESQYAEVLPSVNVTIHPAVQVSPKAKASYENKVSSHRMSISEMMNSPLSTVTTTSQPETLEHKNTHEFDAHRSEILGLKRKALTLKREGNLLEAREVLRQAKLLEKSLEASGGTENASAATSESSSVMQKGRTEQAQKPVSGSSSGTQEVKTSQIPKKVSGRDRFKLQQESLAHKRNALKLRREGKIAESEAEFELAKALESQLEELSGQGSSTGKEAADDVSVEDLLDPQLMSALKSIGWEGAEFVTKPSVKPEPPSTKAEPKTTLDKGANPRSELQQLEEQIKSEKLRALHFKKAGKQAEALESLRSAKRLEKKLGLLK